MLHRTSADRAACIDNPALFQHELLEDPSLARGDSERQRQLTLLTGRARATCADCPLFESCLYDAVVSHDIAGFVAGTTQRQRSQIRANLGVTVEPDDFDTFAGVTRSGQLLNHDELLRMRRANPDESLVVLAMRLGCSVSTVKRHMRRAREATTTETKLAVAKPTIERVLAAFEVIVRPFRSREGRVA
ncbi:MAG: WhiB family transcriptional regulator [Micropruina sp.]|uniref:WhiB family transcriptional regulator n=1 Tax=Micropruina sp. TaxID=2737536 RepID=UPI0039E2DF5C